MSINIEDVTKTQPAGLVRQLAAVEWPTVAVALICYGGTALLIVFWDLIPLWLAVPLAGYLVALHGSLTHEAIHGHPTRTTWINEAFAGIALALWIPYRRYRDWHVAHHATDSLSTPERDTESFYVSQETWQAKCLAAKSFLWINQTLLGRVTLGVPAMLLCFWGSEIKKTLKGDVEVIKAWFLHALGLILLFGFISAYGQLTVWEYALYCALPGVCLTALRTYLEHQPGPDQDQRCAIVESNTPLGFVFLFNNLHLVHHDRPGLPWYKIPGEYRRNRETYLARNGGYYYRGYLEVIFRYLFRAKEAPVHPGTPAERVA